MTRTHITQTLTFKRESSVMSQSGKFIWASASKTIKTTRTYSTQTLTFKRESSVMSQSG